MRPSPGLRVRGPGGSERNVDAAVIRGSPTSLTPPATMVVALGPARRSGGGAVLADGSVRQFDIDAAEGAWDGGWRPVLVSAVGAEALPGMRLLARHGLRIAVLSCPFLSSCPLPCCCRGMD